MCPVVLLALILSVILLLLEVTAALSVTFRPSPVNQLKEDEIITVSIELNNSVHKFNSNDYYDLYVGDPSVVEVLGDKTLIVGSNGPLNGTFELRGKCLGHSWLQVINKYDANDVSERLAISVIRKTSQLTKIFTISVAVLISMNYINMGCALDMTVVLQVLKRPIAPTIGFVCQYTFMPLIAFLAAKLLFTESYLQLGLFVFGASPGGGASNMWTVLLGGNLNLIMMPFWLSTLGPSIFEGTTTSVPLHNIFGSLASMTIFLGLGLLFQRFIPKVANICRKILAPVSIAMIIFIIIFGTYANLYMFRMMSWRILLAASVNVWTGFLVGLIAAILFRQSFADQIAIAIETGIQNTGVAIVLLGLSLQQPDEDSLRPYFSDSHLPTKLLLQSRRAFRTQASLLFCWDYLFNNRTQTWRLLFPSQPLNCWLSKEKQKFNPRVLEDSLVNERLNSNKTSSSTLPLNEDNKDNQKYSYDQINWTNGNI
ncbi:unnamed protein product [Oppiella nova]|uniref:Uncharacterized protein n=1 Tax=Oppiella nova TaxID=334625 RepID=A0A7R9QH25_9ACAR|nr:unnamed protein product [Oppiella nova]CAG2164854.1 unnamed protein product [Oppiella nova]